MTIKPQVAVTLYAPALAFLLFLLALPAPVRAQKVRDFDKDRGQVMLRTVKDDLKKNYYDLNYHGMDLDARFKKAEEKIKTADSMGHVFGIIAQTLLDLNDSHTFFLPPAFSFRVEYGWQVQMIGDLAFVVAVKPGSDAEAKGLRPGDRLVSADGIELGRQNLWVFKYLYNTLRPRPGTRLQVVKPDGKSQQIDVVARVIEGKRVVNLTLNDGGSDFFNLIRESENYSRLHRHRYLDLGDTFIWKMPQFDMARSEVDDFVNKFRKSKSLLLDLRGNSGGYVETLHRLLGNFFDHDLKVGDVKTRKDPKPMIAKTRGSDIFSGKLVVLIDAESGSAAELFARVVQLEKRGTVVGDVSAGAVMRAQRYSHQLGTDTIVPYEVSITDADIIMADGKSLEGVGVIPDQLKLHSGADLAAKRDPVLAYAASLLGLELSAEKAGAMFPIEWKK